MSAAKMSAATHPSTIAGYFKPISAAEYRSQVAAATQVDIMDLRSVVPVSAADVVAAADVIYDLVAAATPKRRSYGYEIDDFVVDSSASESDSLSSLVAAVTPKRRRYGYEIDDFVVDSSAAESDSLSSCCE
jgi:hypothetical protein